MVDKEVKFEDIKDYFLVQSENKPKLDDVILIQDNAHIKTDMLKFIEETKHADILIDYKLGITRSIFFGGEPGLGKTFLAQAMATELGYPIHILDVGEILKGTDGLERMNQVFNYVTNPKNQPVILFLDECDSVAKSRENVKVDESTKRITNLIMQVLNEQNKEIDSRLIVFAASNYTTGLDAAFMTRFMIQEFFMLPTDYIPFIEMEVKKNNMFELVKDMTEDDIKIINKNARIAKYSIRELNAAVTRAEKDEVIALSDKNMLTGDKIPLKLSAIMMNIASTPKVNLGGMKFDKVVIKDEYDIDFDAPKEDTIQEDNDRVTPDMLIGEETEEGISV